jgi:hypothetical protein
MQKIALIALLETAYLALGSPKISNAADRMAMSPENLEWQSLPREWADGPPPPPGAKNRLKSH